MPTTLRPENTRSKMIRQLWASYDDMAKGIRDRTPSLIAGDIDRVNYLRGRICVVAEFIGCFSHATFSIADCREASGNWLVDGDSHNSDGQEDSLAYIHDKLCCNSPNNRN